MGQGREQHTVVVGIDGTGSDAGAVRYALETARRRGYEHIRLVHVVHETAPMTPMLPLFSSETLRDIGTRVVTHAAKRVEDAGGGRLTVDAVVEHGSAPRMLLRNAEDASLIVLGHRQMGRVEAVFNASTATPVAARAGCPVISVPAAWEPGDHQRVAVGVDGSAASQHALRVAFEEAAERGAALTAMHAWMLPAPYADLIASPVALADWEAGARAELSPMVTECHASYPDLSVELDVRYQHPIPALVDLSGKADLLVLGRHGHGLTAGLLLGSVPRALLRRAHCPVEIAVPAPDESGPGRVASADGP